MRLLFVGIAVFDRSQLIKVINPQKLELLFLIFVPKNKHSIMCDLKPMAYYLYCNYRIPAGSKPTMHFTGQGL